MHHLAELHHRGARVLVGPIAAAVARAAAASSRHLAELHHRGARVLVGQ